MGQLLTNIVQKTVYSRTMSLSIIVYWDGDLVYFIEPSPGLIYDHICAVFIQFASIVFLRADVKL